MEQLFGFEAESLSWQIIYLHISLGDQLDITCVTKSHPFQKMVVKFR
jgi:hypothetical protein